MLKGRKVIYRHKVVEYPKVTPVVYSSLAGSSIKIKEEVEDEVVPVKGAMEIEEKSFINSKKPGTIFMIIILIIGFYVIYDQFVDVETVTNPVDKNISITKIDETKGYIYYLEEKDINLSLNMVNKYVYKDVVININTDAVKSLTTELNNQNASYAKKYVNDKAMYECVISDDSKKFIYRDYNVYESDKYISLIVIDNSIDICGNILGKTIKTYVIDKSEGIIYNENSLMYIYKTNREDLIISVAKNRKDGKYADMGKELIVSEVLYAGNISLYIDNNNCLGAYYISTADDGSADYSNAATICK